MPRVTQEHLDSRRRQILDAARSCFIENGFHATSMQDILKASELSAGAVYRYFPSKESIVAAIAADSLSELTSAIEAMAAVEPPPPLEVTAERLTRMVLRLEKETGFARIVVQLWGEAVRNPRVKDEITGIITGARERFSQLIQAHQRAGTLNPDIPAADITATLVSLFPGFVLQHVLIGDVRPETFRNGVRAIVGSAVS
ncbi:MAG TPA: TetR/AcrR family transcriptional regulator [Mycobacteriales bacterium]|nr:TetR/AcrR family transcriptional regulator [Mycobacteriales bacterium]